MRRNELPDRPPCTEDWSAMTGDARRRRCATCATDVHDLSAMTEAEAEAHRAREPRGCIRFTYRRDGSLVHLARSAAIGASLVAAPAMAATAPASTPGTVLERLGELVELAVQLVTDAPPPPVESAEPEPPAVAPAAPADAPSAGLAEEELQLEQLMWMGYIDD